MQQLLAIFIGGGLGSLARFGIGKVISSIFQTPFPLGTLIANILSCLILGIVVIFHSKLSPDFWFPMLIIGFCGGFSTFSTFSFETLNLMRSGQTFWAITNIIISIGICTTILYLLSLKTE